MARYRGKVEQARRDLRASGMSTKDSRAKAPHLADQRQATQDRHIRPYSWLGGKTTDDSEGTQ